MIKLLTSAAVAAVLAFGAVPIVSAQEACDTPADVLARLSKQVPDVKVFRDFEGDEAHDMMEAINSLPPVTEYTAERVIFYFAESIQQSYYVASFDEAGCKNHSGAMPAGIIQSLLLKVEGASL